MTFFLISYKRNDAEDFVDQLQDHLHSEGLLTWRDTRNIPGGKEWQQEIEIAIKKCHAVLLILTDKALTSKPVEFEWIYALGAGKEVIPLKIRELEESDIHYKLKQINWKNFTSNVRNWDELIEQLKEIERLSVGDLPLPIANALRDVQSTEIQEQIRGMQMLKTYDLPHENRSVIYALTEALKFGIRNVQLMAATVLVERSTDYSIQEKASSILRLALLGIFNITSETIIEQLGVPDAIELVQAYRTEYQRLKKDMKPILTNDTVAAALREIVDQEFIDILFEAVQSHRAFDGHIDYTNRINSAGLLSRITDDDEIYDFFDKSSKSHGITKDDERLHSAYDAAFKLMYYRRRGQVS